MQVIRRLKGSGSLCVEHHPPTKALYYLNVFRSIAGPNPDEIIVTGQIEAALNVMLSAVEGRAALTLENGSVHQVVLRRLTGKGSEVLLLEPVEALIA